MTASTSRSRKSPAKTPARSTSKLERTPGHGALEQERMRSMLPRCRVALGPRGADLSPRIIKMAAHAYGNYDLAMIDLVKRVIALALPHPAPVDDDKPNDAEPPAVRVAAADAAAGKHGGAEAEQEGVNRGRKGCSSQARCRSNFWPASTGGGERASRRPGADFRARKKRGA